MKNQDPTGRLTELPAPAIQNIPMRTELGRQVRDAFVKPVKLDVDYAEIERRMMVALQVPAEFLYDNAGNRGRKG
jgi:DNA polymerase I-like protein with 3'-5' exonuclease and polymerase domains